MQTELLDQIEFKNDNHAPLYGVIDFTNDKFVHFYNLGEMDDVNLITIAIEWRLERPDLRFSVYCSLFHKKIVLPRVNILNRKHIITKYPEKTKVDDTIKKTRFSVKS